MGSKKVIYPTEKKVPPGLGRTFKKKGKAFKKKAGPPAGRGIYDARASALPGRISQQKKLLQALSKKFAKIYKKVKKNRKTRP